MTAKRKTGRKRKQKHAVVFSQRRKGTRYGFTVTVTRYSSGRRMLSIEQKTRRILMNPKAYAALTDTLLTAGEMLVYGRKP